MSDVPSAQPSHAQQLLMCVAIAGSALVATSCASTSSDEATVNDHETEIVVIDEPTPTPSRTESNGGSAGSRLLPRADDDAAAPTEVTVEGITRSVTDPNSIWVVVNKQNPLLPSYEPDDLTMPDMPRKGSHLELRAEAARALMEMSRAANDEVGKPIQLVSGYRSYGEQKEVYEKYVAKDGQENADTYSARPGYSEHQTGLVADFSTVHGKMEKFGDSKVGKWTLENSWKYGFINRYTPENSAISGYQSEPWHYRYIGKELAKYYHDNGFKTLEQALDQPIAPDYK